MFGLLSLSVIISLTQGWHLVDEYYGNNFFSKFSFYTAGDPTHGFVNYVDYGTAKNEGLIRVQSDESVYIGCDHTNVADNGGRHSVKLQSKAVYNYGLFILSLKHMPHGCGTWPAYWLVGPSWPNNGEIDVIEGVDNQATNAMTLHTSSGCNFKNIPRNFTGSWATGKYGQPATNCDVKAGDQYANQGCGIKSSSYTSYGSGLNSRNGGVYATQWTDEGIFIWFWNTGSVPSNVYSTWPDPSTWGKAAAAFPFGSWCPSSHFRNMKIIFDLTFCGDWDGGVFGSHCPGKGSCNNYVKYNPSAFKDAYWNVDWIKVYK